MKKGPEVNAKGGLQAIIGLILMLSLAVVPVLAQSDIFFTASVNQQKITSDQIVSLRLLLSGAGTRTGQPQIPPLDDFIIVSTSQSTQLTIVNGKASSQVTYNYQLQPAKVGTLIIPSISIEVEDQVYQTEPINIEVTQAGSAPVQPGQTPQPTSDQPATTNPPAEGAAGQNIYVEADVDKTTPVVGEQVIYTFRLYQAIQLFNQPRLDWPEFTGFLGYDLEENNEYYQNIQGQDYLITEVRRAIFPTVAGEVTIPPAVFTIPGDFFNRAYRQETNAVTLNVQPLPGESPEGFAGAVGSFNMEAWVEPTETRVNEPVKLLVRITGQGNIEALPDPSEMGEEAFPGWRVYDAQATSKLEQQGDQIVGEKVFERLLVPKVEGELAIPDFGLVYFNPQSKAYATAKTTPLTVKVEPGDADSPTIIIGDGKQDVIVVGSDIRHIKPAPPTLNVASESLLGHPLYWLGWVVPFLAVLGTWGWSRQQSMLAENVAYARAQRARKLARKRLKEARELVETDEDAAYAAVAKALTHYLGDKLNLPSAGLTRDAIQQALDKRAGGQQAALTGRFLNVLDWADSGRFAPLAAGRSVSALIAEAEAIITELETLLNKALPSEALQNEA